jgi:MoCo/4Fe-4S cofactor protein with predicted Tat translocation signal
MKRLPIVTREQSETFEKDLGHSYWRTPEDRAGSLEFRAQQAREFVDGEHEAPEGVDRRTFVTLMGASFAMAGLAGCRRPEEKILPYAHMPEDMVPGRPTYYATSAPWCGSAVGLVVESHEGRPTKIEGNPAHPGSLGATTPYVQALVLDLYDPDRSTQPLHQGKPISWKEAEDALAALGGTLRANGGAGLAIVVEEHRSPTTRRALETLARDMPQAKVFRWEAFGLDNQRAGLKQVFGKPMDAVIDVGAADVVLALDADFLGCDTGSIRNSKGWSRRRRVEDGPLSRVYVAESSPTETGFAADHRLRLQARQVSALARAVAAGVDVAVGAAPQLDAKAQAFADAVAADLKKAGPRALVIAGRKQPPGVHALAAAMNDRLGAVNRTVRHVPVFDDLLSAFDPTAGLAAAKPTTVIFLGGNPVFNAPADAGVAELLKGKTSIHLSTHQDETSVACTWHIPRAHLLESWGDTIADDGTVAIVQPLIAPMYGGKTDAELLEKLVGGTRSAYDLVRSTAAGAGMMPGGAAFEMAWRRAVHDGVQVKAAVDPGTIEMPKRADGETPPPLDSVPAIDASGLDGAIKGLDRPAEGAIEITFAPDPHAWDGRFANCAWLQELPDPVSKACWASYAAIAPATAKRLNVVSGDHVTVTGAKGGSVTLPALIVFGQADDTVQLTIGQGRSTVGRVGKGVGVDTGALRRVGALDITGGTVAKAAGSTKIPVTQGHFSMEGRPLVREQTVAQHQKEPGWARELVHHPPAENLFQGWEYHGHKWGMAIDLSLCTGCGSCVTACQAENNTPVLGPEGVLRNREMHWIRIDRYFEGPEEDPRSVTQPMTCQHCENAPCEQVCPVNATTHSPEGINEMTYNRCIGTKYCGNNCPYKVRRFNYFNYTADIPATTRLQLNPDVTVRSRGVMEKCSFCVQRINQAKIAAKTTEGRTRLHDGEVVTACQQACPTEAIAFGDLNDGKSEVSKRVGKPRSYQILRELNTRPRMHYLARISNPNPALVKA